MHSYLYLFASMWFMLWRHKYVSESGGILFVVFIVHFPTINPH